MTAFQAEGCGIARRAMSMKSALRDWLSVSYVTQYPVPPIFSFPLEGKCHVVAKGCTRVSIPMKLTIVLLGPTSADFETLCRVSTKRRIVGRPIKRKALLWAG